MCRPRFRGAGVLFQLLDLTADDVAAAREIVDEQHDLGVAVAGGERVQRLAERFIVGVASRQCLVQDTHIDLAAVVRIALAPGEARPFEAVDDAGHRAGGEAGLLRQFASGDAAAQCDDVDAFEIAVADAEMAGDGLGKDRAEAAQFASNAVQRYHAFDVAAGGALDFRIGAGHLSYQLRYHYH